MLALASQGCGSISNAPHRAVSPAGISTPEAQTANPTTDKLPAHTFRPEIPPIATVPSSPKTEQPPPIENISPPLQPTLMETGLASWYGPRFHGKLTASGEVFYQEKFTAAHPTLPWGSRVKVTNLANGKSVEVRINDRGLYGKGRIIDVSRAAARALGMVKSGITTVEPNGFLIRRHPTNCSWKLNKRSSLQATFVTSVIC
jgi:rare lipoprotein A (peptidoglycan hydrolase)